MDVVHESPCFGAEETRSHAPRAQFSSIATKYRADWKLA